MSTRKDAIKAALKSANDALSSKPANADHLGDLVWCDPNSGWKANAHLVQRAFAAEGLDPVVLLPQVPDYQVAFSRAILAVRTMIQGKGYTLLQAAAGENGESRYSICRVHRNATVHTIDEATYRCPKDGQKPFVERTTQNSEVAAILEMIAISVDANYENYTSDDVRQAFVRQVDMYAGVPCRNSPPHVVYWISPQGSKAVQKVADVLESLGWGNVSVCTLSKASEKSNAAIRHAVNSGLEAKLTEFAEEAKKFAEEYDGMRPSTIEKRIEEAATLRKQAELYKTVLGSAVQSVDDRILTVENSLRKTLGLVQGTPIGIQTPITPPKSSRAPKTRDLTAEECKRRAEWERMEAHSARTRGDSDSAAAHDKKAIAYDLMAEAS